jgi:hypothetical protein
MPRSRPTIDRCLNLDLFAPAPEAVSALPSIAGVDSIEALPESELPAPAGPADQLDLFRDSPAEIAASAARRALEAGSAALAREKLAPLRGLPAYVLFLADCERCLELVERRDARWRDAAIAVPWIESELWPAAERCLARSAMRLLRPALLALLDDIERAPLPGPTRHAHPAYLWQILGEPAQAVAAIERDPHWPGDPKTLIWHAELSERGELHARVHADVAELCFAWPDEAEAWLGGSRTWAAPWTAWCDLDEILPAHAFPAWARLTRATEFPLPAAHDTRPGAALLRCADALARNPADLALRKALHSQSPTLMAAFLEARGGRAG